MIARSEGFGSPANWFAANHWRLNLCFRSRSVFLAYQDNPTSALSSLDIVVKIHRQTWWVFIYLDAGKLEITDFPRSTIFSLAVREALFCMGISMKVLTCAMLCRAFDLFFEIICSRVKAPRMARER